MYINVFYDSPNDCDLIDLSLPNFESVITLQDNFLNGYMTRIMIMNTGYIEIIKNSDAPMIQLLS